MATTYGNSRGGQAKPKPDGDSLLNLGKKIKIPSHLSPEAKKTWKKLLPQVAYMMREQDVILLESLCEAYSMMRSAQTDIQQNGLSIPDTHGGRKTNPACRIYRESVTLFNTLSQQFGLSPAARAKLTIGVSKADASRPSISNVIEKARNHQLTAVPPKAA